MLEVGVLLGGLEPRAARQLVFFLVVLIATSSFPNLFLRLAALLVLFYAFCPGLFQRRGFGFGFGFGFGCFCGFFALDFAVFGCVPGVEDLMLCVSGVS